MDTNGDSNELIIRQSLVLLFRIVKRSIYHIRYNNKSIHKTVVLNKDCSLDHSLKVGAYSFIGPKCTIYPNVSIGRFALLANNVCIIGGDHIYNKAGVPSIYSGRDIVKPTIIGEDVWIGARSIIMTGVTIGDGAIVAAGSVVTKDIPPYAIYGGVPAKFIKMRFSNEEIETHKKMLLLPDDYFEPFDKLLLSGLLHKD